MKFRRKKRVLSKALKVELIDKENEAKQDEAAEMKGTKEMKQTETVIGIFCFMTK